MIVTTQVQTVGGRPVLSRSLGNREVRYTAGDVLIKANNPAQIDLVRALIQTSGGTLEGQFDEIGWSKATFPETTDVFRVIDLLKKNNLIRDAEPSYIAHTSDNIPCDAFFDSQWSLYRAAPPGGTIQAVKAWDITTGDSNIVIAVLDTGIPLDSLSGQPNHCDLDNPHKITLGSDWEGDNGPSHWVRDRSAHGSLVAGIAGAEAVNKDICGSWPGFLCVGIAGISWGSRLYIDKVFDQFGFGTTPSVYKGLVDAVRQKIPNANQQWIINFSGGFDGPDTIHVIEDAIAYAYNNNVLCVFPTGNLRYYDPQSTYYIENPAIYASYARPVYGRPYWPNVIAVGASNFYDSLAAYSKTIPTSPSFAKVSVVAPGGEGQNSIISTVPTYSTTLFPGGSSSGYEYQEGGSIAAPHISGVAALIWSLSPNLKADSVRTIIERTADKVGPYTYDASGYNGKMGHGRANAYKALRYTLENFSCTLRKANTVQILENLTTKAGTTLTVEAGAIIKFGAGVQLIVNGSLVAQGTAAQPITFTSSSTSPHPGDWYGIVLTNNTNTNYVSTISYCNVSYATYGFYANTGWNTTLDHCTIQNSSNSGLYINNSITTVATVTLSNSTISNNAKGVSVLNGDAVLTSSTVTSNIGNGVELSTTGKLHMQNSSITNNAGYGIYVNGATAYATITIDYTPSYNHIENNTAGQIYVSTGGAFLGQRVTTTSCICDGGTQSILDGSTEWTKGNRRVFTPQIGGGCSSPCYWQTVTSDNGGYNYISGPVPWVYAPSQTVIEAQLNYWGQCPNTTNPSGVSGAFPGPGTVDYLNYKLQCNVPSALPLSADIDGGGGTMSPSASIKGNSGNQLHPAETFGASTAATDSLPPPDSLQLRRWIRQLARDIIDHPADTSSIGELQLLATLIGPGGKFTQVLGISWGTLLGSLATNSLSSSEMKLVARAFFLHDRLANRDFTTLFDRISSILATNPPDRYWISAQSALVLGYLAEGDIVSAKSAFLNMQLRASGISPEGVAHLAEMIGLAERMASPSIEQGPNNAESGVLLGDPKRIKPNKPTTFLLEQNYPNPFNPTTRFSYALPVDAQVSLRIFNVLGQEVSKVVDDFQTEGYKTVEFDASSLSSGLYFYRLQAGKFTDTKKMMLVK
ncbi:MAG: S8 family serine peptidase [Ignavibacteria bacterium]|nr:S8 family serine peptidase [Ignavibacteria bacterium]